jgi:RNAse (barnase) inhibitor barstar
MILDGKEKNIDGLWDYLSGGFTFKEPLALECMHPTPKNKV